MYTYMFGTTNEYCPNSNLSWSDFFGILENNDIFKNYGINCILPAIFNGLQLTVNGNKILDSYKNGGSNNNNSPNLYYYQSTDTSINPIVESGCGLYDYLGYYANDIGVVSFFNETIKHYNITTKIPKSNSLGGYIQWNNYFNT